MKKIIIYILTFAIIFTSISFNCNNIYGQNIKIEPNNSSQLTKEQNYISQLKSISDQLEILSSNTLSKIINNQDKTSLMKDVYYIKSQIRSLRLELSEYHKTESGNIEKNPISVGLLNTLNFYSMALSYLTGALEYNTPSDESKYLQNYYISKSSGDTMLLWLQKQVIK